MVDFKRTQKNEQRQKGVIIMSTEFAIQTLIELFIGILLVYGFMHEEKFIDFEQNVKRIVVGNIRRIIRISRQKREVK